VRVIDLPRAIVWDGLVDPVLVEGWFDPVLRLVDDPAVAVLERRDPELLRVEAPGLGALTFAAEEVEGGTRGTSTRLAMTGELSDAEDLLDRLEDLLRGHPVDWRSVPDARSRPHDAPRTRLHG
jgi:hypothetical protein